MNKAKIRIKNNRTIIKLLVVVVGMFGFGFALVPIYNVFCDLTGINGKTAGRYEEASAKETVDKSRLVRVQFVTQRGENIPWEFRPTVSEVKVHPGELTHVDFLAKNLTNKKMIAQAVPSLSPSAGVDYFHKTECFCFSQQTLAAKEERLMPLVFLVDKALPEEIKVLTLSYTMYDQSKFISSN